MRLTATELLAVHHIGTPGPWEEIAGVERSPVTAATWARANSGDWTADRIAAYHEWFVAGRQPPPIGLVGPAEPSPEQLVVLEGNKRVAALCMGGVDVSAVLFLLGTSPAMRDWPHYPSR